MNALNRQLTEALVCWYLDIAWHHTCLSNSIGPWHWWLCKWVEDSKLWNAI